jgi:hypothetical protein
MNATTFESFKALKPPGDGCLTVHAANNDTYIFRDLNLDHLSEVCPLLAFSFEEDAKGGRRLSINASSIELIARFLRFLYADSYDFLDEEGSELPCSFLLHAQLYHYAELYDVPRLLNTAYIHVSQICELGCSMPCPPIGLCETLRYLYQNVKDGREIHESILHYCIAMFNKHKLGENVEFIKLLSDVSECSNDLHKLNMDRGFWDESKSTLIHVFNLSSRECETGSAAIIQLRLPSNPRMPNSKQFSVDHLYDMFGGSTFSTPAQTPLLSPAAPGFTLVHRPRRIGALPATEDSDGYSSDGSLLSDLENFSLGSRHGSQTSLPNYRGKLPPLPAHDDGGAYSGDESITHFFRKDAIHPDPILYGSDANSKNGFSDADDSDSDWSVVSDDMSSEMKPKKEGSQGSLYMLDDCASSTETIIAAIDVDPIADEDEEAADDEIEHDDEEDIADLGTALREADFPKVPTQQPVVQNTG